MRGVNVQKIVIEREENEKLYRAWALLKEFSVKFGITMDELGLNGVEDLNELNNDIIRIKSKLGEFIDDLGYCDYIEIEG